jgi:hypothetical protein
MPNRFSSADWNVYRTRFLIRAKQLAAPFSFTDPLGRKHSGVAGDYLVQSSEGLMRIAPREIFEDVYVVLAQIPENPAVYPCNAPLSS